jgi:CheY-like chemotaxis protein
MARILYVDDEEFWCEFIPNQLRDQHVDAVRSYAAAIDKLNSEPAYDVALVDLNLRGDDDGEGRELLELLLRRYPETKRIVVTGKRLRGAILRGIVTRYQVEEIIVKAELQLPDLRRTIEDAIAVQPGELPQPLRLYRSNLQQRYRDWQSLLADRLDSKLRAAEDHLSDVIDAGDRGQTRQQAQLATDRARARLARFREVIAQLQPLVANINSEADFDAALAAQERAEEDFSDDGDRNRSLVAAIKRVVSAAAAAIPGNLMIFIAAVFLSYGVNAFTTIYAVPGHPVHSFALWCSFASSVIGAGLWTALAAKKERIEKAAASSGGDLTARKQLRTQMWSGSWLTVSVYLGGGAAFSILAMVILVFP